MNTDNMTISGETLDYGPCAFMEAFDPATVFSSIDDAGRYAYGNQPRVAQWNLARFGEALLPLLDTDLDRAVAAALGAQPEVQAQLLDVVGRVHVGLGEYGRAQPLLERVVVERLAGGRGLEHAGALAVAVPDQHRELQLRGRRGPAGAQPADDPGDARPS
jgi:hypothetical protein